MARPRAKHDIREVHRRFADWAKWRGLKTQDEVADVLKCTQVAVSNLMLGARDAGLKLALTIEAVTADWPEGTIRATEWLEPGEAPPAAEPAASEPAA